MRPAIALHGLMIPPARSDDGGKKLKKSVTEKKIGNEVRAAEFFRPPSLMSPPVHFANTGNANTGNASHR
jgi:hypothetical protein